MVEWALNHDFDISRIGVDSEHVHLLCDLSPFTLLFVLSIDGLLLLLDKLRL